MSEKEPSVSVDFSGGMFVLGVFVLIVLFWGEPDIHQALIESLMSAPDTTPIAD